MESILDKRFRFGDIRRGLVDEKCENENSTSEWSVLVITVSVQHHGRFAVQLFQVMDYRNPTSQCEPIPQPLIEQPLYSSRWQTGNGIGEKFHCRVCLEEACNCLGKQTNEACRGFVGVAGHNEDKHRRLIRILLQDYRLYRSTNYAPETRRLQLERFSDAVECPQKHFRSYIGF